MRVFVQFSGGKDSTASLLYAINQYGINNVTAVFCDTGWESPITYQYIKETIDKLKVKFITLKGKYDFIELAQNKKRFPSLRARFCTDFLKNRPFIDFLLKTHEHCLIVQGIRSDESRSRFLMQRQCRFFKYYLEPYNLSQIKVGMPPKTYSYRKKEVILYNSKFEPEVERPFFNCSADDVLYYSKHNGINPNPLYYFGFKRVGCFPCVMCSLSEVKLLAFHFPNIIELIAKYECDMHSSFFSPSDIPKRFCKNKIYPTITDMVAYVNRQGVNLIDFPNESKSCLSVYNICE
jgi:3'-phosphoadenosine 5'-phosphosulfate sulfotransferase (PAPS reductase)/FAD synthetase